MDKKHRCKSLQTPTESNIISHGFELPPDLSGGKKEQRKLALAKFIDAFGLKLYPLVNSINPQAEAVAIHNSYTIKKIFKYFIKFLIEPHRKTSFNSEI